MTNPRIDFNKPAPAAQLNVNDAQQTDPRLAPAAATGDGGAAFMNLLGTIAGGVAGMGGGPSGQIVQSMLGSLGGGVSGIGGASGMGGIDTSQQMQLLQLQNQIQSEQQVWTTLTNISKSEHETRMDAIRNIKA
ncbi:MAG: hypothetical protein ABSH20_13895 [Tepidisphaeraceae bacterium]|jgi:hypothetical protein